MYDFLTRVVLATDGSEGAALAARAAVDLSNRTGAELHVIHVWRGTTVAAPVTVLGSDLPRERAARILEEQVERIRGGKGEVEGAHLRMGRPAEEITALAGELDADLVVVGSRGAGAAQRLVTGSVSEEVARHAPCPTLVVRGGEDAWPPQAVVVGDDLSGEAERAGYVAARIGGLLDASGLLVRAFPSQAAFGHAAASRWSGRIVGESGELLRRRAIRLEDSLGKRPAIRVAGGDAAAVIRTAVGESEKPALVAVGSRGLDAVGRLVSPSVSTSVLRAASGPVLIYPSAAKNRETHRSRSVVR
jgi:nucleotide-binding universal stress UspA family protein